MATKHLIAKYKEANTRTNPVKRTGTEDQLQFAVYDYLQKQYPKIIDLVKFNYKDGQGDVSYINGVRTPNWKRLKFTKSLGQGKAFPDLMIFVPRTIPYGTDGVGNAHWIQFHGFFLELKKSGTTLYKKDGGLRKNEHVEEQYNKILKLQEQHYYAEFAVGFDEAKYHIDKYFKEYKEC